MFRASDSEPRPIDRDRNVNGRRGSLTIRSQAIAYNASSSSSEDSESEASPRSSIIVHSSAPDSVNLSFQFAQPSTSSDSSPNSYSSNSYSDSSSYSNQSGGASNRLGGTPFKNTQHPSIRPNAMKNRQKQLESLRRMEERIRSLARNPPGRQDDFRAVVDRSQPMQNTNPRLVLSVKNAMAMYVLDISAVLTHGIVSWLPLKSSIFTEGPEETILYTLVAGKGELIMFGGIQKDATSISSLHTTSNITNTVSNSLHFISAPKGVI